MKTWTKSWSIKLNFNRERYISSPLLYFSFSLYIYVTYFMKYQDKLIKIITILTGRDPISSLSHVFFNKKNLHSLSLFCKRKKLNWNQTFFPFFSSLIYFSLSLFLSYHWLLMFFFSRVVPCNAELKETEPKSLKK